MALSWLTSQPFRLYRSAPNQKHDLSVVLDTQDIYEEDQWGRLCPADEMLIEPQTMDVPSHIAELWAKRGIDLAVGYFINVKKARIIDGEREAVTTKLSAVASVDDTALSVYGTVGFECGDQISVKEGATLQLCKVKTVGPLSLTVYDEDKMRTEFAADSTVYASRFYRIIRLRSVQDTQGLYQGVIIQQIVGTAGMG